MRLPIATIHRDGNVTSDLELGKMYYVPGKDYMSQALKDSIAELGRVVVLSIIPVLVASVDAENGSFSINPHVIAAVAFLAALRFLDKWLHKSGVAVKGLSRF